MPELTTHSISALYPPPVVVRRPHRTIPVSLRLRQLRHLLLNVWFVLVIQLVMRQCFLAPNLLLSSRALFPRLAERRCALVVLG